MPFEGEIGKEYSVLITEMAHDGVSLVGHNKSYDQILIKGSVDKLMGKRVTVRVTATTKHSMLGEARVLIILAFYFQKKFKLIETSIFPS